MIKFAVMTFMYNAWAAGETGSHERLLEILKEAGADGAEAFCNSFFDDAALLKIYQNKLADLQLKMPVMDLIVNLAAKPGKDREDAYEVMRKGIDICESFGTEIIHIAGCRLGEGECVEDAKKLIAEGMLDFIDDVEKRGMTIAFENFDPSPKLICTLKDCQDIMTLTNNRAKFVFDTGNFKAVQEDAAENFDVLFDNIKHFHFKDFQNDDSERGYSGTHFGEGVIKNREVAQKIVAAGYTGWVALESYPQAGNGPEETVAKELKTLKSFFA